jgi:histidinol-phosphate aminotransferase
VTLGGGADPSSLPIRDDLRGQVPYGAPQLDVKVRLNTNENPFGPSEAVRDSIAERVSAAAESLNRYPDRDAVALRRELARYVTNSTHQEISADQLWPANGSNEVLQQLLQAFGGPGRTALGFEPSYSMHRLIARGTGTTYLTASRGEDFSLTKEQAVLAVQQHQPDVVFLCSPNNPTGTALDLGVVSAVVDVAPGMVIVDEAYGEFSKRPSAVSALPDHPRLVVVRTMSKAFALAGARIGYAVAAPEVVAALQLVRLPYHLSAVTQALGLAALDHTEELLAWVDELKTQRDRIATALGSLGYTVVDSDANFVFFGGIPDQGLLWRRLLESSVLIRDVGIPGYLRVTAGTDQETAAFLDAIRQITRENVA